MATACPYCRTRLDDRATVCPSCQASYGLAPLSAIAFLLRGLGYFLAAIAVLSGAFTAYVAFWPLSPGKEAGRHDTVVFFLIVTAVFAVPALLLLLIRPGRKYAWAPKPTPRVVRY